MPSHAGLIVSAYLLIPRERAETPLPATVCFHQCNVDCILAKDAVVGKTGEATLDQRYGLELVKSTRIEPPWDLDDPRKLRSCLSRRRPARRLQRMGLCPNSSAWIHREARWPLTHQNTAVHRSETGPDTAEIACTGNTRLTIMPFETTIRRRAEAVALRPGAWATGISAEPA